MEDNIRYTEKLARCILIACGLALTAAIFWYLSDVLIYILLAVVVSLLAKPMMTVMRRIKIKGKSAPNWFLATLSLILILGVILSVIVLIVPIGSGIVKGISLTNIENAARSISLPLSSINEFLRNTFPQLGEDFRLEVATVNDLHKLFDISQLSSALGSALASTANFVKNIGVGVFCVIFISYFFIKDDGLFTEIVCAVVPDKYEDNTRKAITDIGHLLSRYFLGVTLEITGVTLINFIGLALIARLGFNASISIAFLTGLLNIIPYIGPLIGVVLGTGLGLIIKFSSIVPPGVGFWAFLFILLAIFCFTQLIDNYLYQPLIYSATIKAKPLEIFIVMLIVGSIGGVLAMIVAIPCYTVVRVIAFRFFRHIKAIRRLIPDDNLIES